MPFESLGIIETSSVSSSLKVISEIKKTGNIKLIGKQVLGDGIVSIFIEGNLGAIKNALNLGAESLSDSNEFRSIHIIPLPHKDLLLKFNLERNEV